MAASLLEADQGLAQDCVEKADGHPLFLEQLLRNVSEGAHEEIPGSIQSLVQARLDCLAPRDKDALRAASVIGQRFSLEALRHLLEDQTYECNALVQQLLDLGRC